MADNTLTKIVEIELDASKALNSLIDYNKAIAESTALEKEAKKAYGETSKEYEIQHQKTQALKKEKQTLQREVQNEIKMETKAKDSLNAMRAELSNLTKQYDNLSKAERENANIGGKLQKQIVDQTKAIKAAEYETERYYRNVGNYTNSILDAIGMNNELGQAIMANGGNIKATAAIVGQSVKSINASLMTLMANPAFVALAGIVGAGFAFKWWADYNKGIAEATRLTKEFTGLAGQELTDLRSSIQATADVMGKDYVDVLKTADTLMAHYHITGEEAMDIINKGFAAGADLNGNMLQLIQQNAAALHDAGLSAREMVAVLAQTRSGIFGEDGLQVIGKAAQQLKLMSSSTKAALESIGINAQKLHDDLLDNGSIFDAIRQISEKIGELPDNSQEAAEAIKDLFGKVGLKASREMIDSLATMSTNLDEVMAQTGDYGKLLLEQIDTEKELEKVTADLFAVENGGWEAVTMKAKIYGNEALTALVNSFRTVRNALNDSWSQLKWWWGNLTNLVSGGWNVFKGIGQAALKLGGVLMGVGTMIKGVLLMSPETIVQGYDDAKNALSGAWSSAISNTKNAVQTYKSNKAEIDYEWLHGGATKGNYSNPASATSGGGGATSSNGSATSGGGGAASKGGKAGASVAEQIAVGSVKAFQQQIRTLVALRDALGAEDLDKAQELTKEINMLDMRLKRLQQWQQGKDPEGKYRVNDITSIITGIDEKLIETLTSPKVEDAQISMMERLQDIGKAASDVSQIMGTMGQVVQGNAGEWLKWGANVIGTISRAIPQLASLFAANEAVAGSEAMAQNAAMGPFGWVAGIAAIGSIIAALAALPKFATGGYISGAGTGTSDSIPARLSNGESVINANSTAMFGGLLSALNQFGGGAPIQANASARSVQGEEMLTRAFLRGAASMPAPVVGVREFTRVSDRVVNIKDTARL